EGIEAVDSTKFVVHSFAAQTVAHRGARFHSLHADATRGKFIRHAPQHLRAMHVHSWRRGKVEHDQPGRGGFGSHSIHNAVAHVVHVEIHEARLRPEDHHAGN